MEPEGGPLVPPAQLVPGLPPANIRDQDLRQNKDNPMTAEDRRRTRLTLLDDAFKNNDPTARDELEGFLAVGQGTENNVMKPNPVSMPFETRKKLNEEILKKWYDVYPTFEQQINDRNKAITNSSFDEYQNSINIFKMK